MRLLWVLLAWLATVAVPGCRASSPQPFFAGLNLEGLPSAADLRRDSEKAGFRPDLVGFYLQWPATPEAPLPASLSDTLAAIQDTGALPVMTWEPMFVRDASETAIPADEIIGGRWNPYLEAMAGLLAALRKPVCIRFAHEMNIPRYFWGSAVREFTASSPALFRSSFRHVATTVRSAGAANTLWMFCPNAESIPDPGSDPAFAWNTIRSYHPGADVVDLVGLDGYNWGSTRRRAEHGWDSSWRSFSDLFRPGIGELREFIGNAPLLIGETACPKEGGDREAWIREALESCVREGISGILWFQVSKETDWSMNAGEGALFRDLRANHAGNRVSALEWAAGLLKPGSQPGRETRQ